MLAWPHTGFKTIPLLHKDPSALEPGPRPHASPVYATLTTSDAGHEVSLFEGRLGDSIG